MTTPWVARREAPVPEGALRLAVKDNIDVAGFPTTAGCPAFAYEPTVSAPVVTRLEAAGAVVVGKAVLDQFATGLVGTRGPSGPLESPLAPGRVSGGSSSGSAVVVATGEADVALGTDTAGSGRVPAAFCGVVGLKPTKGWLPTEGVVPACRSFDCVSVFARSVAVAATAVQVAGGPTSLRSGPVRRVGVPSASVLAACGPSYRAAWEALDLAGLGYDVVEVDLSAYLAAGELLYGGALVAERHAAVGAFVDAHPDDVDPVVGPIIAAAGRLSASEYLRDIQRLAEVAAVAAEVWEVVDAVVVPTAPRHPTVAEVAADPVGVNAELGRFTNGCNLVDWCGAAVPAGTTPDGLPFGVTVLGPAWHDPVVWSVAAAIVGEGPPELSSVGADEVHLAVCGAHLEGQPLHHQLTDRGARLVARTATAPTYRLVALDTTPPKPGLVRVATGGAAIEVEVWALGPAGFGSFVAEVPAPLAIGTVLLADGSSVPGFTCEAVAVEGAADITGHGGWRAYLAASAP